MGSQPISVLVVEDDPAFALLLQETLARAEDAEFRVTRVQRLGDIPVLPGLREIDLILLDLGLPDSQGLDTVILARGLAPGIAVVVLTGSDDRSLGIEAVKHGAQDYMVKGQTSSGAMERSILFAIERHRAQEQINATLDEKEREIQQLVSALGRSSPKVREAAKVRGTPGELIAVYIQSQPKGATFEMIEQATGVEGRTLISELAKLMDTKRILDQYPLFLPVGNVVDRG